MIICHFLKPVGVFWLLTAVRHRTYLTVLQHVTGAMCTSTRHSVRSTHSWCPCAGSYALAHHLGAQELVCQERPLRGHLRAPRVPEECPEAVRALIDACIEADAPAQRPSAYEIFVHLATRCAAQNVAHSLSITVHTQSRYMLSVAGNEAW